MAFHLSLGYSGDYTCLYENSIPSNRILHALFLTSAFPDMMNSDMTITWPT